MIKAIIFDLNGIFYKSRKLGNRFEKDFNVPPSVFTETFEIMGKYENLTQVPHFHIGNLV